MNRANVDAQRGTTHSLRYCTWMGYQKDMREPFSSDCKKDCNDWQSHGWDVRRIWERGFQWGQSCIKRSSVRWMDGLAYVLSRWSYCFTGDQRDTGIAAGSPLTWGSSLWHIPIKTLRGFDTRLWPFRIELLLLGLDNGTVLLHLSRWTLKGVEIFIRRKRRKRRDGKEGITLYD